jgi:hypothetical protein
MLRRERWPPPLAISRRGRVAGITTGGGLVAAGVAHAAGSWDELTTCSGLTVGAGRAEVGSQELCDLVGAIAGLWFLASVGLAILGAAIVYRVLIRPTSPGGLEGWTWGWGALAAVGGALAVTRLSTYSCPDGFRLDARFALCIASDDRIAATSNILTKGMLAVAAVAIGVLLARTRWIPASVSSALSLLLWLGGMGWFLLDTVGRDMLAG